MIILVFLIVQITYSTYVGDTSCTDASIISTVTDTTSPCATTSLLGKGWCYKDQTPTCDTLPCYLIDEVAACRTLSGFTGAASTPCDSLETFSLQYDNVCCDSGYGRLNYAFVRFTKTTDGSKSTTTDGTTIAALDVSVSVKKMFQLYTINPWLVDTSSQSSFQTDLSTILNKYITSASTLTTNSRSHPFYMERTVYQALQLMRDFTVVNQLSSTNINSLRSTLIPLIQSVALQGLQRMSTFQPNYYQTNYYFVNFASIPYSRLSLTLNGQLHQLTIDWSTYSYTDNGYLLVYSYAAEQFGIQGAYTDLVSFRPFYTAYTAVASFAPISLKWYWSDTSLSISSSAPALSLYTIDDQLQTTSSPTAISGITFTCVTASRYCTTTTFTPTPNAFYFIGKSTLDATSALGRAQCILGGYTWTVSTSTCA